MSVKAFAPGRVNAMGDHIDYLGGWVLPLALPLGTQVGMRWIEGDHHRVYSDTHGEVSWPIQQPPAPDHHWFDYCVGALADLPRPVAVEIHSDLPQGSGLSSSASLLVALITARSALNDEDLSPLQIAQHARQVEVEHIGLNCGIMDQYASALGQHGHAMMLDCQALTHQDIKFELGDAELWAIDSKAPRKLAGGVYNQRVEECAQIASQLGSQDFFTMRGDLPAPLDRRLRHIQSEQKRVQLTANAASGGDLVMWGELMNESHQSLSQDYEVAGEALDRLQSVLAEHAYGARMTGGGFGGCVIALIAKDRVDQAREAVRRQYGETQWIGCTPSDGARLL